MNVLLTESQVKQFISFLLQEGITYTPDGDKMNVSVDPVKKDSGFSDAENANIDSRIFGTKKDILYGDGTGRKTTFNDRYADRNERVKMYKSGIEYIKTNGKTELYVPNTFSRSTIEAFLKSVEKGDLATLTKNLELSGGELGVISGKYNRVTNLSNDDDVTERYQKGVVPGTAVELITLFDIDDFNISDIMKNGYMRSGGNMVKGLFNGKDFGRDEKVFGGVGSNKKIPVTYDKDRLKADVKNNFSLSDEEDRYHFNRKNFGYGDNNYTTVTQFLDKSIMYAAYVLNKENVHPSFILSAPSSSKYNDYYCRRLSDKIGAEYNNEFFKRNIVNAVFDKDLMRRNGCSEEDIELVERELRKGALTEMAMDIAQPIKDFVSRNEKYFTSIRYKKSSRSFLTQENITSIISAYLYDYVRQAIMSPNSTYNDLLSQALLSRTEKELKSKYVDLDSVRTKIQAIINKGLFFEFNEAVKKMAWIVAGYHDKMLKEGYYPKFENKRFKIVSIPQRLRVYVKNAYVIADKELNAQSGELLSKYRMKDKNGNLMTKFLLFDEDVNSGATLKILIDAMNDKGVNDSQIVCLANAYSPKGK